MRKYVVVFCSLWHKRSGFEGHNRKKNISKKVVFPAASSMLSKGWMMKTQRRWLWPWVEEAALTLTSVRNVPGRFSFARPVVVPSTRPVMGLALEYLDCASIKMTPLRRHTSGEKKQLLMSSEISHNNVGQSDLRQTLVWLAGRFSPRLHLPTPYPPPPSLPSVLLITSPCGGQ